VYHEPSISTGKICVVCMSTTIAPKK